MTAPNERRIFRPTRRSALVAAAVIMGALVGLAGIYGIDGIIRNPIAAQCQSARETTKRIESLARGEVAAFAVAAEPGLLPELRFRDADGRERSLAEWRGRLVLFNLWATWCVPCRQEMPSLDALQGKIGGPPFEVVSVNIDTRNLERPKAWLKEYGITKLAYYADPTAKVFQDLKAAGRALGMPTTILVDPQGCELGTLAGAAEWGSEDAVRLIQAALGQSQ
jgi:thiol-disulfide isomerase/thioredoxin